MRRLYALLTIFILCSSSILISASGNEYLAFADKMPQPVGGIESIYKSIHYPELARRTNVQGNVYLLAFINEKGKVDDVKLVKGIGAGCDEEALKVVGNTKFTPGEFEGKPVKVKVSLQIKFKLK